MDFATDAVKLLVFLIPGFISLKLIEWKCDIRQKEYQYFVVDALIYSLVVYAFASIFKLNTDITNPRSLFSILMLAIVIGIIAGEAKNKDLISVVFHGKQLKLSGHDKIFSLKAAEKLLDRWHVIGLKNGKEICGIIREFDTNNNEMWIENAYWVIQSDSTELSLSFDSGWLYLPPSQEIEYIRVIESEETK
jgi:hypothetical protein